jgi:hypothetical protein
MNATSLELGSSEHRRLLARFFLDSHLDYVPERIQWPRIEPAVLEKLHSLTFWQEAVSTENVTSNTVAAAAVLEPDPEVRRAIELQGFEENRHARLLQGLTAHYHIKVDTPPAYVPRELENDFLSAGFGECFDSFFAFGLFALAQQSGFFPTSLVSIFEPVIQEEARHILFFVNWVRYRRSQLPWWQRPLHQLKCGRIILQKVLARARTARSMGGGKGDDSFTLNARDQVAPVTLHGLLDLCLRENERRLADYDRRLLRPRLVPTLARLAHRWLPKSI